MTIWDKVQNGVFVIAEIGKGFIQTPDDRPVTEYLENAKKLACAAKEAGVDAVKFQTHIVEDEQVNVEVVSPHFKGSDRYSWVQRNMRATPRDEFWVPLQAYCAQIGIPFFSTPMSRSAARVLHGINVPLWKVGSGDMLDFVLLEYIASTNLPIILSTGMSTLAEVDHAVEYLKKRNAQLAILHCVSKYPCPPEELHLASIQFLRDRYDVPTGFSDHSIGVDSALAAVALGATVIEKHFSFDRALWGSDHKVSMTPDEMARMVVEIREIQTNEAKKKEYLDMEIVKRGMGKSAKDMNADEAVFRPYFRKTLTAGCEIPAGTKLASDMIYAMRPQIALHGLPSEAFESVVGKVVNRMVKKYEPLTKDLFT